MTLPIPSLDDRRFEDLVEEAGKLIPVYAPRWTDHNIHDPGITVIDLAAWLTETAIYRLNLVTEERKLKYLEIMGVTPKPPGRAELDLSFDAAGTVKVEKGTPFYTTIREERIYFEIQEEITVVPARLEKVIADKCVGVGFDRSQRNEMAGAYFHPFGRETKKGSAIYLGFDRPDETVSFTCYLYEKDLVPKGTCGNEPDYKYKNSKLKWQYTVTQPVEPGAEDPSAEPVTRIGWREIEPQYDGTEGFKKSGRIIFKEIEEWKTAKIPIHSGEDHFCWLRCVVEKSYFEYPPRIESIRINTVTARHGLTVRNEQKQQEGTGYPHQEFKLDHSPVCRNPKVTVTKKKTKKDGDEWVKEEWSQVENFDAAGPGHRYYTLDYEAGKIHFGDGLKGSIPPAEAVIAVTPYIAAGGEKGNLAANCDWRSDAITGIIINNHNPAAGGTAAETVEEALIRCRKGLKRPYTAVTNEDLEYYAKHTPGLRIAKAKAIPHYMQTPASPAPPYTAVTVVIIPFTPEEELKKPPRPSPGFLRAVYCHLEKHRLLGTELRVQAAIYIKVEVKLSILPLPGYPGEKVEKSVNSALNRYLHPVRGGKDHTGWPIGRDVYRSGISECIEKVEGVDQVFIQSVSGDNGVQTDNKGNLILPGKTAATYPGKHIITILKEKNNICKPTTSPDSEGV